jgi:outer membrane protein
VKIITWPVVTYDPGILAGEDNSTFVNQLVFNKESATQPLHSQPKPVEMKNVNAVLHGISLVAIAILFFLFLKPASPSGKTQHAKNDDINSTSKDIAIAYFEMDTVERNYKYIKDVQEQLKGRQQAITNDLNSTKKQYMGRIQQLQGKAPTMSQQEGESAQAEINQMQLELQQKEARLNQELQEQQFKLMQDINSKIENFLETYNKNKKYVYIFSHSPGDFMYYKDSLHNITGEIIKGLNETYKKP